MRRQDGSENGNGTGTRRARSMHRVCGDAGALDEAAARRIVDVCYDRVLAYCRRHAPAGVDPQDVAQEAFLRLARSGGGAGLDNPLAYLTAVARNLCIDAYRSRRVQTVPLDDGLEVADSRDELGDAELAWALERLDPDLREIVELRFDQGLALVEAARVLGISRFAAARRLKRALALLKDELAAQPVQPEGGSHDPQP